MTRLLALDAALGRPAAAIVADGTVLAARTAIAAQGQAGQLARMVADLLGETGLSAADMDAIAATVGPGSFTGIRAALALAHGLAAGADRPMVAVTVAEALAEALPRLGRRALWVAITARQGRVFLDRPGGIAGFALGALPDAATPVAVAGTAAPAVAAYLAARGADVMLTDARHPLPRHIALAATRRLAGALPPLPPHPLYIDPPEARPAANPRPVPAP